MPGFLSSMLEVVFSSSEKRKTTPPSDSEVRDEPAQSMLDMALRSPVSSPLPTAPPPNSSEEMENATDTCVEVSREPSHEGVHFSPDLSRPPMPPPMSLRPPTSAAAKGDPDAATSAVLAIANPSASHQGLSRVRSLSRLFTKLPDNLPTYPQMLADQLEYLMHIVLLETSPRRASQHMESLKAVYETFRSIPNGRRLLSSGRLYSRSMLTSLASDVAIMTVDGGEHHDVGHNGNDISEEHIVAASDLKAENWDMLQQQLEQLREILLRKNANAAPQFDTDPSETQVGVILDEQLAKHTMMTVDYEEVILLLAVQKELTGLKERLQDIADDSHSVSAESTDDIPPTNGTASKLNASSINTLVQKAMNGFMKNLSSIYPPDDEIKRRDLQQENDDEEDEDSDDMSDDNDTLTGGCRTKRRYSMSNIPKELHSLALTELYSPKRRPTKTSGRVDRILADLLSITSDAPTPAMTTPGIFSHANLQSKVSVDCQLFDMY
jgi:hypothetical protein